MKDNDNIRKTVSEAYGKAVLTPIGESCCCGDKGSLPIMAGYTKDQMGAVPKDAVDSSFGCGNPLAYSQVKKGQVVLDLGSGAGIDLILAAQAVGPEGTAIGVDMTDEMLAAARKNVDAAGLTNVDLRKGIIEQLPVDDNSVDWVVSNCVINLSPEKSRVFAEIARVLKPGGQMLVSDIVAEEMPDWATENADLYCSCISGAVSEADYLAGLEKAGLTNVEVKDRLVYEASQIATFVDSSDPTVENLFSCCGGTMDPDALMQIAKQFAGKIWSAKIYAKKL